MFTCFWKLYEYSMIKECSLISIVILLHTNFNFQHMRSNMHNCLTMKKIFFLNLNAFFQDKILDFTLNKTLCINYILLVPFKML